MPIQKVDRREIIKNSLRVFKEKGYNKTTMADLADASGLLKGSLYHYFPSKSAMMSAVLEFLDEHYQNKIFSVKDNHEINGRDKLIFLMNCSEEIFLEDKGGCLMASIALETGHVNPEFKPVIQRFFGNWKNCFFEIFLETKGEKRARELAEAGVAEIEGAVLLMELYKDPGYLHRAHERLLKRYNNDEKTN